MASNLLDLALEEVGDRLTTDAERKAYRMGFEDRTVVYSDAAMAISVAAQVCEVQPYEVTAQIKRGPSDCSEHAFRIKAARWVAMRIYRKRNPLGIVKSAIRLGFPDRWYYQHNKYMTESERALDWLGRADSRYTRLMEGA